MRLAGMRVVILLFLVPNLASAIEQNNKIRPKSEALLSSTEPLSSSTSALHNVVRDMLRDMLRKTTSLPDESNVDKKSNKLDDNNDDSKMNFDMLDDKKMKFEDNKLFDKTKSSDLDNNLETNDKSLETFSYLRQRFGSTTPLLSLTTTPSPTRNLRQRLGLISSWKSDRALAPQGRRATTIAADELNEIEIEFNGKKTTRPINNVKTKKDGNEIRGNWAGSGRSGPLRSPSLSMISSSAPRFMPKSGTRARRIRDFTRNFAIANSCLDLQMRQGATSSGLYLIHPPQLAQGPWKVYCDLDKEGGGWLVFQTRDDVHPRENFMRNWQDYKLGFGQFDREFWLGNLLLWALTNDNRTKFELSIELEDWSGNKKFAVYNNFRISGESDGFRLRHDGLSHGNAGDALGSHRNLAFSTFDADNDEREGDFADRSCARLYKGGWWYGNCHDSNLNGWAFGGPHRSFADGINWFTWTGYNYSLKRTIMKFRPKIDPAHAYSLLHRVQRIHRSLFSSEQKLDLSAIRSDPDAPANPEPRDRTEL